MNVVALALIELFQNMAPHWETVSAVYTVAKDDLSEPEREAVEAAREIAIRQAEETAS